MTYTQYRDFRRFALDLATTFRDDGRRDFLKATQRCMAMARSKRVPYRFNAGQNSQ
jgi:hypothetical protein